MSYDSALAKINALAAMVIRDSISPDYLADVLREILTELDNLDERFSVLLTPIRQKIADLIQADQDISSNLTDHILAFQQTVTALQQNLQIEMEDRERAEAVFARDINSLQQSSDSHDLDINTLKSKSQNLSESIDSEITDRAAADTALAGRIDSVEDVNTNQDTAISYLRSRDTATNTRIDDALARLDVDEGNIEAIAEDTDTLSGRIDTEISDRSAADTALAGRIDSIEDVNSYQGSAIEYLRGQDTAKGQRIDTLESDLRLAETNIEGVAESLSGLEAADSSLSARIDSIRHPIEVEDTDQGDLVLADAEGNPLLSVSGGHVMTENFDSSTVMADIENKITETVDAIPQPLKVEDTDEGELVLADEQGTPLLSVTSAGHIRTAAFDSSDIRTDIDLPIEVEDTDEAEVVIADEQGTPLLSVTSAGHIRTAVFDSSNIDTDMPIRVTDTDPSDIGELVLADQEGTPLLSVTAAGHIVTASFDSSEISIDPALRPDKLYGKKWVILGDSATEGWWGASPEPRFFDAPYMGELMVYPYYIGRRTGIDVVNRFGPGDNDKFFRCGRTLARSAQNNTVMDVYQQIPADTDYITIYIGCNDSIQALPIYDPNDSSNIDSINQNCFVGAYNVLLSWLVRNRPYANIGIIVGISSTIDTWPQFVEIHKLMAQRYGIAMLDLCADDVPMFCRQSEKHGMLDWVRTLREQQYEVSETNSHPNEQAHELQSHIIEQFLRKI